MKKILEHCLWWLLAVLVFLLIIGSWLSVWFLQPRYFPEWEVAGQSGDMFGSLNALFSGLAFAGFLITMFMQQRDLAVQSVQLAKSAKLRTAQFELLKEDKIHRERLQNLSFEPHFMLRARNVYGVSILG